MVAQSYPSTSQRSNTFLLAAVLTLQHISSVSSRDADTNFPLRSSHGWIQSGFWNSDPIEDSLVVGFVFLAPKILGLFGHSILDFRRLTQVQEHIGTRLLLKKGHTVLTRFWWHCYLLLSDTADFRQNYMEAWRQRREQSIRISVSDELLTIPIPQVANDEVVLRRLRMFCRMVIVGQGIPGLLLPKKLERIDCIKVRHQCP